MSAQNSISSIKLDARKFIHAINNGALSRVTFLESAISKMGAQNNQKWRLVSVDGNSIIFEDINSNTYMLADIAKTKGNFTIDNIRQINIVEEEKASLFEQNCRALINAIGDNKFNDADKAFRRIEAQRFRSSVIPESGLVTTKDGITRKVTVSNRIIKENYIPSIIKHLSSQMKDSVEIAEGRVVRGTFKNSSKEYIIPINEYTRRRIVARYLKETANKAYKSGSFCKLVSTIKDLVVENKLRDAVGIAAKFLTEEQEFCLLSFSETTTLLENALACSGIFDTNVAHNLAALFYKTNLKVNRDAILQAWTRTAQMAENAPLLHNVKVLSEARDFGHAYGKFLNIIFNENAGMVSTRAKAYKIALEVLAPVLEKIEGAEEEAVKMREMIDRLGDTEVDDATLYEVEELLDGLSDELVGETVKLADYDDMPDGEDEFEDEEDDGKPVSLPEVGEEPEDEMGGLGGGAAIPGMMPQPEAPQPLMAGRETKGKAIAESNYIPVERMGVKDLSEELEGWKVSGHIWLHEDGFDDCFSQMQRYIKRCHELGPTASTLRESFEKVRDVMLETGADVVIDDAHDPYAKTVLETELKLKNHPQSSDIRMDELQAGKTVQEKNPVSADGRKGDGAKTNTGNVEGTTRMDELQTGKGVQAKSTSKADGRKGDGAKTNTGNVEGTTRMDELQTGKTVMPKNIHDVDGRKGGPYASSSAVGEDKWFHAGPSGDADMGKEFQGDDSVESKKPKDVRGHDSTATPSASGAEDKAPKGGERMGQEFQGKGGVEGKTVGKGIGAKSNRGFAPHEAGLSMRDNEVGSDKEGVEHASGVKASPHLDNGGVIEDLDPVTRMAALLDEAFVAESKLCSACEKACKCDDECDCSCTHNVSEGLDMCKDCKKPHFGKSCPKAGGDKPVDNNDGEKGQAEAISAGVKSSHKKNSEGQYAWPTKGRGTVTDTTGKKHSGGTKKTSTDIEEDVNVKFNLPGGATAEVHSTDETIDGAINAIIAQLSGSGSSLLTGGETPGIEPVEPVGDTIAAPDSTPELMDGEDEGLGDSGLESAELGGEPGLGGSELGEPGLDDKSGLGDDSGLGGSIGDGLDNDPDGDIEDGMEGGLGDEGPESPIGGGDAAGIGAPSDEGGLDEVGGSDLPPMDGGLAGDSDESTIAAIGSAVPEVGEEHDVESDEGDEEGAEPPAPPKSKEKSSEPKEPKSGKSDKKEKSDKSDKSDKKDKPEKSDKKSEKSDKKDKSEKKEKSEESDDDEE